MSVVVSQLVFYGSANMPEADSATTGGAVDFTKRVGFADLTATMALDVVSSSASDTATKIQVVGRDASGTPQTPASVTLTGTTLIASTFGAQAFQRLEAGVISGGAIAGLANPGGTAAVGDVAVLAHTRTLAGRTCQAGSANAAGSTPPLMKLQSGDGATLGALTYGGLGYVIRITGGTGANQLRMVAAQYSSGAYGADIIAVNRDWSVVPDATSTYDIAPGFLFDLLPNPVTAITRCFYTSQSDVPGGSTKTFYEKIFAVNTNATTAFQGAAIQILSETPTLPAGALLDLGLTATLNDTATVANRQSAPGGVSFVTQPATIAIPTAPGSLPNGNSAAVAQACWMRLTLPAGAAPYQGAALGRITGSTT